MRCSGCGSALIRSLIVPVCERCLAELARVRAEELEHPLVLIQANGQACTNLGELQLWIQQTGTGWAICANDGFHVRLPNREQALRGLGRLAGRKVTWAELTALKDPYTTDDAGRPVSPPVDRGNGLGED